MKTKVIVLWVASAVSAVGSVLLSFISFEGSGFYLMVFNSTILLCMFLWSGLWMRYISQLLGRRDWRWSFEDLDRLREQQALVKKKFQLAERHVAHLANVGNKLELEDILRDEGIGQAISRVRNELEKLRQEEDQRHWMAEGVHQLSEILREKGELRAFAQRIINHLVRHLGMQQGALFVTRLDEQREVYLTFLAGYAYPKAQVEDLRIYAGEGMLGQSMIDRTLGVHDHLPENYIRVSSGLGDAVPHQLVLMPLVHDDELMGAIEIGSFKAVEPHHLEFIQSVSKSVAAEIAAVKEWEKTELLLRASEDLTLRLQMHEEELSQQMEELVSTQDQMTRKQAELESYMSAINNTIATVEFDLYGNFITANDIFLRVTGYHEEELTGRNYQTLMNNDAAVQLMWDSLKQGQFFSGEFKITGRSGKVLWLNGTFNPISTGGHKPDKVMMFAQFTTQEKEKMVELTALTSALKHTLPLAEWNEQLECRTGNEKFMKMFGLTRMTVRSKSLADFVEPSYHDWVNRLPEELSRLDHVSLALPFLVEGQSITYEISLSAIRQESRLVKIIMIFVRPVEEVVTVMKNN